MSEYFDTGYYFSPLMLAINKCDTASVQLLISYGLALMSDYDFARTRKNIYTVLSDCYASISNVLHWCRELHWSFPTTDRETLNWLRRVSCQTKFGDACFPTSVEDGSCKMITLPSIHLFAMSCFNVISFRNEQL